VDVLLGEVGFLYFCLSHKKDDQHLCLARVFAVWSTWAGFTEI
jgi:hypothetical protein